jgi:DNA polymerase (family X)
MNNKEIARIFQDIADILEVKGENVFKIRAYQKVARTIEQLPVELDIMVKEDRLREVPGVGDAIEKKIIELVTTGKLNFYETLKAASPVGITALLNIPGVGPKTASILVNRLGVKSIEDLEKAIFDNKITKLPRVGEKTAKKLLYYIQSTRT